VVHKEYDSNDTKALERMWWCPFVVDKKRFLKNLGKWGGSHKEGTKMRGIEASTEMDRGIFDKNVYFSLCGDD